MIERACERRFFVQELVVQVCGWVGRSRSTWEETQRLFQYHVNFSAHIAYRVRARMDKGYIPAAPASARQRLRVLGTRSTHASEGGGRGYAHARRSLAHRCLSALSLTPLLHPRCLRPRRLLPEPARQRHPTRTAPCGHALITPPSPRYLRLPDMAVAGRSELSHTSHHSAHNARQCDALCARLSPHIAAAFLTTPAGPLVSS